MSAAALALAGRVALVTGSGRNIGRAIARALAAAGATVVVNVRASRDEGQAVVDEICAANGGAAHGAPPARLAVADITQRVEVDAMLAEIGRQCGRLDILVNNAALRFEKPFAELSYGEWRRGFDVCVDGAFHCTQAALPWLMRSDAAAVVNIGGLTAHTGAVGRPGVVAAKSALVGLTRALALELAPSGITVNCVAPGLIDTTRVAASASPNPAHRALHASVLGRRGEPGEVADAVAWLAGPHARYVTGQTLHVNGGAYFGG